MADGRRSAGEPLRASLNELTGLYAVAVIRPFFCRRSREDAATIRQCYREVKLNPQDLEVTISYRLLEAIMN